MSLFCGFGPHLTKLTLIYPTCPKSMMRRFVKTAVAVGVGDEAGCCLKQLSLESRGSLFFGGRIFTFQETKRTEWHLWTIQLPLGRMILQRNPRR